MRSPAMQKVIAAVSVRLEVPVVCVMRQGTPNLVRQKATQHGYAFGQPYQETPETQTQLIAGHRTPGTSQRNV